MDIWPLKNCWPNEVLLKRPIPNAQQLLINEDLAAIIMATLRNKPQERIAAKEFVEQLENVLTGRPIDNRFLPPWRKTFLWKLKQVAKWARRNAIALFVSSLILFFILATYFVYVRKGAIALIVKAESRAAKAEEEFRKLTENAEKRELEITAKEKELKDKVAFKR